MLMQSLPDVVADLNADIPLPLQWVGMEGVAVPISMCLSNRVQTMPAKANVYVSLETPEAKGIHMSRLHKVINQLAELECNKANLDSLLDKIVVSQSDIGQAARIELSFDLILVKPALLSGEIGYQLYPVKINAEKRQQTSSYEFEVILPYSSTCPCSASLSRQLYADAIDQVFSDSTIDKADLMTWVRSPAGSIATPHSQRSYAHIRFSLEDCDWPDLASFPLQLEEIIGTPVQTAVKRSDEQAFAKLNAENRMFCEDAARRIKFGLERMEFVKDYWLKVEHQESLHAHNAVVIDQKLRISEE